MPYATDYSQDPVCRLCEVPYDNHPRCQSCGIFCGPNHFQKGVSPYRGHQLCSLCIAGWKSLEVRVGCEVSWKIVSDRSKYLRVHGAALKYVRV